MITKDEIIRMARKVWGEQAILPFDDLERFAALVAAKAAEKERETIMGEWWMCVQSDLENGVKSLNERAAEKWKKEYPAIAGFAATIEARGKEA